MTSGTMQAAWYEAFGAAADVLRVGERPRPAAAPGEVLVKLRTSGINPSDVKKRAGSAPALLDEGYVIPNSDGAGVIEAVGEGVDRKRIGERVWGERVQELNDGTPVDRVIDVEFGANLSEVLGCVRTGGVIATYSSTQLKEPQLPFLRMMYQDLTLRLVLVYSMPESAKKHAAADIAQAFRRGTLRHRIGAQLPLAEIARASELVEQGGSPGCVILQLPA